MEYLVVPGQAVGAQATASGVSTLHVEAVEIKAAELSGGVEDHPCRTSSVKEHASTLAWLLRPGSFTCSVPQVHQQLGTSLHGLTGHLKNKAGETFCTLLHQ